MQEIITFDEKMVYPIMMPSDYGGLRSINCYLYKNGDDITLVDAGIRKPEFEQFFWQQLAAYGVSAAQINRIVLTHFHADHIGVVDTLVSRYGMPVYASELAIPRLLCEDSYLQQKLVFYEDIYTQYNVRHLATKRLERLAETAQNKERIMLHTDILPLQEAGRIGGLRIITVPGHSPDSLCLHDEETGWLFAGDFLLASGMTSALLDHDEKGQLLNPIAQYMTSIQKLQQLQISQVFAGHEELFSNTSEVMAASLSKMTYKLQKVVASITNGSNTATILGEAIYGPRFAKSFVFTISEIVGLTLLAEQKGLITRQWLNDEWTFSAI